MFDVAVGAGPSNSSVVSWIPLLTLLSLGFPKYCFLNRVCARVTLRCTPLLL